MSLSNIVFLSLAEIVGDFGYKDFARSGTFVSFIQGSIGYISIVYFLIECLKQGNILWVNSMWDGVSALIETVASYVLLGERLNHWTQYIGILLIVAGLLLLRSGGLSY